MRGVSDILSTAGAALAADAARASGALGCADLAGRLASLETCTTFSGHDATCGFLASPVRANHDFHALMLCMVGASMWMQAAAASKAQCATYGHHAHMPSYSPCSPWLGPASWQVLRYGEPEWQLSVLLAWAFFMRAQQGGFFLNGPSLCLFSSLAVRYLYRLWCTDHGASGRGTVWHECWRHVGSVMGWPLWQGCWWLPHNGQGSRRQGQQL